MAETPIVTAMLVSMMAVHLFGVGTPVFAGDVPCVDRCNLGHGECTSSNECRPHELLVKTVGHNLLVLAKTEGSNGDDTGTNRKREFRCHPGWEGPDCNQCTRGSGCVHGTCHQPWQCNCLPGWGGRHCDLDQKICERTKPCQNDATCINSGNGEYLCVCKPNFGGLRCEIYEPYGQSDDDINFGHVSTATSKPPTHVTECQNGGLCKITALDGSCKKCICKAGFTGDHCETTVDDCLMMPCANGGKCYDMHNDFHCECDRGFTGRYCEDDIDECVVVSNICHNGGTCNNSFGSYDCVCSAGYTGVRCDEAVSDEKDEKTYISLITRVVAAATEQEFTTSETTTLPVAKPPSKVVKNPEIGVKVTKITNEVRINTGGAQVLINPDSSRDANNNSTMQVLTFVFMGVAILILGAILALIWVRCFRSQSKIHKSEKVIECAPQTRQKSSSIVNRVKASRNTIYHPPSTTVVQTVSDSVEELDETSMQPCIPRIELKKDDISECPSPPPPYALSAVDARRNAVVQQPYFVAIPPKPRLSKSQLTEKRRVLLAAYDMTSRNDIAESSSLLEVSSPTLSHKIVV